LKVKIAKVSKYSFSWIAACIHENVLGLKSHIESFMFVVLTGTCMLQSKIKLWCVCSYLDLVFDTVYSSNGF